MTTATVPAAHKGNLLTRSDTMLGICQGLGDDLGFSPDILRIALGVVLVWMPWVAVGTYLGLGIVVLASRLIFPNRSKTPAADVPTVIASPVAAANEQYDVAQAA